MSCGGFRKRKLYRPGELAHDRDAAPGSNRKSAHTINGGLAVSHPHPFALGRGNAYGAARLACQRLEVDLIAFDLE